MIEFLWEPISTMSETQLVEKITSLVDELCYELEIRIPLSINDETAKLLNHSARQRFKTLSAFFSERVNETYLNHGIVYQSQEYPIILNCWILLGALIESVLQMFLSFYYHDYVNSEWQLWENANPDEIKRIIEGKIDEATDGITITTEMKKSFKRCLKNEIKKHTSQHDIKIITLDELIVFFTSNDIIDESELRHFRTIQTNRNGIHSFQDRVIDDYGTLVESIRFFCYFLQSFIIRLPDMPDC